MGDFRFRPGFSCRLDSKHSCSDDRPGHLPGIALATEKDGPPVTLFQILRALDTRIADPAEALIVISDRSRETYTSDRGVPADRIHVLQNWGETSAVNVDASMAFS